MIRRSTTDAFSLLEVIVSTVILVTSSMILLRLIAVGSKHQDRSERRAWGQIVCHDLVDQWVIDPVSVDSVERSPVPGHPGWDYEAEVAETDYPGVRRVRIRVFANVSVQDDAMAAASQLTESELDARPTFELVRWMRAGDHPGASG
ncbi:type IV pilus modification PilV family protein [Crateriforma conspicua]|uniref:Uncharacterized protein n=1 Tax=Crateriforma conspicua TaxID=2527996 RepID=A0A5C5Y400_9PLAN|nr:hypothetical protein [Crateriforma conspicua]TWT70377.1 hypothetical protein Pan14r_26830 [Crateriforma conspicua]